MAFSVVSLSFLLIIMVNLSHQQAQVFDCGRPTSRLSSRILGGVQSGGTEFPWMVHLGSCGGVLITDRHILTASHCLENEFYINITLGSSDLNDSNRQVVKRFSSAGFSPPWSNFIEDDIAIITLKTPVVFSDYIQPVCLPSANDTDHVNDPVVITGWGAGGTASSVLRKINTTVISSAGFDGQCQLTAGFGYFDGSKIICSEGNHQRRYCSGDDGGPMNYYDASVNRWFVIGLAITSNCQDFVVRPNVFIRIRAYLNFIKDYTNQTISDTSTTASTTTSVKQTTWPTSTTTSTPATSPIVTQTKTTSAAPGVFSCEGKPNRNYPDPTSTCSKYFYICSNGFIYRFECSAGTVYNRAINECDWPVNVAGCR